MSATKQVQAARLALMSALYRQQIGKRIKKRRKELGLTQQDLADAVGVGVREIPRWEGGHSLGRANNLEKVANALELAIEELMGDLRPENKRQTTKEQVTALQKEVSHLNQRIANLEQTVLALIPDSAELARRASRAVADAAQGQAKGSGRTPRKPAASARRA